MKRTVVALAAAPALVLLALSSGAAFLLGGSRGGDTAFVLMVFGLPASYASSLAFGVPTFLWFRRQGWLKAWQFALGGAACSLPFLVAWFWGNLAGLTYASGQFIIACALGVGAATAVTFRVLASGPNEA